MTDIGRAWSDLHCRGGPVLGLQTTGHSQYCHLVLCSVGTPDGQCAPSCNHNNRKNVVKYWPGHSIMTMVETKSFFVVIVNCNSVHRYYGREMNITTRNMQHRIGICCLVYRLIQSYLISFTSSRDTLTYGMVTREGHIILLVLLLNNSS